MSDRAVQEQEGGAANQLSFTLTVASYSKVLPVAGK